MGILKTAVRAHVATRVIGNTHRRQQQRWAAQDSVAQAQPVQPATQPVAQTNDSSASTTMLDQLTQLGQLRDSGVLTDAEFEAQKQRIIAGA